MKVVLDANVFVSAMVTAHGNPKRIIDLWQSGAYDVLITGSILEEIAKVLRYPRIVSRHRQDERAIQLFVRLLEDEAIHVKPEEALNAVIEDKSDNRVLECAAAGRAQFIVSGDHHLLDLGEYRGIAILSPAAFVVVLNQGRMA